MKHDSFFKPLGEMVPKLGRAFRPAKVDDAVPFDAPPPEKAPEPEKKKKPASLRNPKWETEKVGFNEETEISVEVELPPEVAHKKKVSFELFASTPKGPERISQGEGMEKDGKAACKIAVYIPNYQDEDGNRLRKVEYFFKASHSEAEPLDGSKSPKLVDEMADRVLEMHILENVTFATGKSFVRTSEAKDLKALGEAVKEWKAKHADGKLAVFGHADAVGEEVGNKALSERRAKAVHAFLAKDPKPWEALYGEEKWGLAAVQELLKHLGHDPGVIDGQDGPKTQAAVKDFQGKKGLGQTGQADAKTREALFTAYFESASSPSVTDKDCDSLDGKPFAGCSEFNLIQKTQGACEENRRVAVLFLKVSKNFPINYPCKQGNILPCQKQAGLKGDRKTPGFRCKFYDGLVVEKKGAPPKAAGKLKAFVHSTEKELKHFVNLPAGPGTGKDIELEVEAEPGVTKVYWKAVAGAKNSKRDKPAPGWVKPGAADAAPLKDGAGEFESEVKDGKAKARFRLGLAGGDKFTFAAGAEKGKKELEQKVVTWRRLWYQLTYRKGITPPGMATAVKQLKDVFIEWVAEASAEHELAAAGNVIVGNHNAADYHKLLKTTHTGQCAHIIFCDKQYDGLSGGSNVTSSKSADFTDDTDSIQMSDPSKHIIVPKPVQQKGAKLFLSGSWENKATGKKGTLTDDPSKVTADVGLAKWHDEHWWIVELPAHAKATASKPVTVSLDVTACSGPWGGDGGTAPHNLIVIDSDDTIHSQCCLHELGHIMNMVPLKGYYKTPPGYALTDHTHAYEKMGGSGSHCSWEIDASKSTATHNVDGKCIMFHQLNKNCKLVYCPECAPLVKAQALEKFHELKD